MGFGKDGKGAIVRESDVIALAALVNNTAIKQTANLDITDDLRILKSEYTIGFTGHTAGEAPIDLYMCNNDLSVGAIAEAISAAQGPLNKSDRDRAEQAERAVKLVGTLQQQAVGHALGPDNQHGVITIKHPWTYTKGVGWVLVAINRSGSTLTTGTIVRFSAVHYGVWVG